MQQQEGGEMPHETWAEMTEAERAELGERIAGGDVWNEVEGEDCFDMLLHSSGRTVAGRYRWESGLGEFEELKID